SGGGQNFAQASHGGNFRQENCVGTFIANATYSASLGLLYSAAGHVVTTGSPGGAPLNANGFTITGKKWAQTEGGAVQVEGVSPPAAGASTVPGSVNGTWSYTANAADPLIVSYGGTGQTSLTNHGVL